MDFFLSCAYPNHNHEATQGVREQLKPWSTAFHVRKKAVTFGSVVISLLSPRLLLGILLFKRTFPSRKIGRFHLRSLPTHHPATWPFTKEDEEKSGLQISLGDFVPFSPLYCGFGVPELFFLLFVGSPVHSSFIATFDDDDDGPFGSKMKGATFQRRPPRTHGQCTHTLGTKNRENSHLQETLLDFVA